MRAYINFFILIIPAVLLSVGFAQETAASAGDVNEVSIPSFPYVGEITGNNIYIRSGPGTNYYTCGKLDKADRVKVVSRKTVWSRIVPPAGSFSWISKRYVNIDPADSSTGIVTGDAVRIYAGSNYRQPIYSDRLQGKLDKGDKVRLMGEEKDDYYKVAPPSFAYLWVSTQYIKPLGPIGEVVLTIESKAGPMTDIPAVVPVNSSVEAEKLKEYYALEKQIEAERARPIAQQNYADIKKALVKIAGSKEAGKAVRYSEFAIKQIERFELALRVAKAVRLQDAQLQQIKEGIQKARAARLAQVPDLGRFAVIGQFQISNIYGPEAELKRYRIIDAAGKTICYALPSGLASKMSLGKFVGRKVGLVGTIEPHLQTSGALVRFAEITELK